MIAVLKSAGTEPVLRDSDDLIMEKNIQANSCINSFKNCTGLISTEQEEGIFCENIERDCMK